VCPQAEAKKALEAMKAPGTGVLNPIALSASLDPYGTDSANRASTRRGQWPSPGISGPGDDDDHDGGDDRGDQESGYGEQDQGTSGVYPEYAPMSGGFEGRNPLQAREYEMRRLRPTQDVLQAYPGLAEGGFVGHNPLQTRQPHPSEARRFGAEQEVLQVYPDSTFSEGGFVGHNPLQGRGQPFSRTGAQQFGTSGDGDDYRPAPPRGKEAVGGAGNSRWRTGTSGRQLLEVHPEVDPGEYTSEWGSDGEISPPARGFSPSVEGASQGDSRQWDGAGQSPAYGGGFSAEPNPPDDGKGVYGTRGGQGVGPPTGASDVTAPVAAGMEGEARQRQRGPRLSRVGLFPARPRAKRKSRVMAKGEDDVVVEAEELDFTL
jgi:hypothetical protein